MNDNVKQRIVGSVVVLAILAIFIPVIFHQPDAMPTPSIPAMPQAPVVATMTTVTPAQSHGHPHGVNQQELKSALELPTAWVVVLGSFKQASHATSLVKRLQAKGLPAYTQMSHRGNTLTRVLVGPNLKKADAKRLQASLQHQFHLSGLIRKYQP